MNETKIRGSKFFYRDLNPDSTNVILLVHGHPFDNSMWNYQIEALSQYRLIVPDLRGYGKSDFDFDKIYIEEQALDLTILLDQLQIAKVHLVGLSMGGQIIVEFARLFPHRTLSLVLCDSNPGNETTTTYGNRLQLAERIRQSGIMQYTDEDIHKYLHKDTITQNRDVYNHLYQMMNSTTTQGAVASHRGRAERRDNRPFLSSIKQPALVVVGDQDFFTPIEEMKEIADRIPNAEFVVVPGAGHMPNMEQASIFNDHVLAFYKRQRLIHENPPEHAI